MKALSVVLSFLFFLVGCKDAQPVSPRGRYIVFCVRPLRSPGSAGLNIREIGGIYLREPQNPRDDGGRCTDPVPLEVGPMGCRIGYEVHGSNLAGVTAYYFDDRGNSREVQFYQQTPTLGWRLFIDIPPAPSQVPTVIPGVGDPTQLGPR